MTLRRGFALGLVLACLAACSTKRPIIPPEKLWGDADQAFQDEAYERAVERYKMFLEQHPFDSKAEEAELRIAQAQYFSGRYAEAIASFGDFERMHPTSDKLAEVEYHLGLAYLKQASTIDRDQQHISNALTYFRNLTDRFPTSQWSERAKLRVKECREKLAGREAYVADYYLRHGNLRAAEARLHSLLTEYPETDATAQSLHAFAQAYAKRDESDGATLALATLVRHHPDGPLADDARQQLGQDPTRGEDPLPRLLARLEAMHDQGERQKTPKTVSAYPDSPAGF